jgi:predicted amidohydrolase
MRCRLSRMKVAALQLCSQENVADNLRDAGAIVREAVAAGAQLLLLPEGFAYLGGEEGKAAIAETLGAPGLIQEQVASWCREYGVSIIAGGLPEKSPDPARPYNTSVAYDESGTIIASYRKIHLFDVELSDGTTLKESAATHPGTTPIVTTVRGVPTGLSICYDLRFPELFRWMTEHGAQLVTVPAAFTRTTGTAHWHVLLRARAIENQCWVAAAAQQGTHPKGRQTFGHALIVDPWGEIVAERAEPGLGFALAEIDLGKVASVRAQMPLRDHRVLA